MSLTSWAKKVKLTPAQKDSVIHAKTVADSLKHARSGLAQAREGEGEGRLGQRQGKVLRSAVTRTWKQVAARVREHRAYGPGFRWLELDVPVGFAAPVAGQFVQLLLDFPSPVLLPAR